MSSARTWGREKRGGDSERTELAAALKRLITQLRGTRFRAVAP